MNEVYLRPGEIRRGDVLPAPSKSRGHRRAEWRVLAVVPAGAEVAVTCLTDTGRETTVSWAATDRVTVRR